MAYNNNKREPLDLDSLSHIVYDIETVPFLEHEYTAIQKEYVQRKMKQALGRNPDLDPVSEESKIKGIDAFLAKIVCIGLSFPNTGGGTVALIGDEKDILTQFWERIGKYGKPLFISYNGIKFDVPFILRRSMKHGIEPTNREFLQIAKFIPFPPHFDVMQQLSGRDGYYSLKQACDFFGIPSPKDGAVVAESVSEAFYSGRISQIAEYCLRDLESTYKVFKILSPYVATS